MTTQPVDFENNEQRLREQVEQTLEERHRLGLEGLVGDLACIIINVEQGQLAAAAMELVSTTGYRFTYAYETEAHQTAVLARADSADILMRCRLAPENPFLSFNQHPKSGRVPNARLETLVFACADLDRYVRIQQQRGTRFLTSTPLETSRYRFIQTEPSALTGNSIGLLQWRNAPDRYTEDHARALDLRIDPPDRPYLNNIGTLDHIATRVRAEHRDPAILEFMGLTEYAFAFAIYVPDLNSITNVSRLAGARFSLVFTSGIRPGGTETADGPTELFVQNYGARAHHMAFLTEDIAATDQALRNDGWGFLSELVGSESSGIMQSFSAPSPNTLLVNEYIQRFGDFDGFFTQDNVARLTLATAKQ